MIEQPSLISRLKPVAVFLTAILLFFFAMRLPVIGGGLRRVEGVAAKVGAGFSRMITKLFESEDSLSAKLGVCLQDRTALARDAIEFEKLKDENVELRTELDYKEHLSGGGVAARVIGRSLPEDPMRVIVDQGTLEGVMVGSVVVVGQGIVLGTVSSTNNHTSVVTLLTGKDSRIPVAIVGKKRTIGLSEGRNGAVMEMNYIPRDTDIKRGDIVTTSGQDGKIPEGLLVGTITEIIDIQSAPFKSALLEPFADPIEWSNVLILPTVGS